MTAIGKLRIKNVRGIRTELPIELSGRSLLLRGDNGSGKSSIVQAVRWAVTGTLTSSNSENVPPEFERHQLEHDPAECHVIIDLLPKGRIVMRAGKLADAETDDIGREYVDACVRSNPFLRRDELLGFLTDTPGDRFKYLERFLDLERVERLVAALGPAAKSHEATVKDAEACRARLLGKATAGLANNGREPRSVGELLSILFAEARRLGVAADETNGFAELANIRAKLGTTTSSAGTASRRIELAGALERALALVPPEHPRSALEPLREAEQHALETDLATLLTEAVRVVERGVSLDSCPLCEQPVDVEALAARLRTRVAVLADVRDRTNRARELGDAWRTFLVTLDALERITRGDAGDETDYPTARVLLEELDRTGGDSLSARVLARIESVRETLKTRHDSIPDELRASDLGKLATSLEAAIAGRSALEQSEADITAHAKSARELRSVEKAVSDARKDTAVAVLKDIEALVTAYYERIHPPDAPDEVTGAPSIKVKRHGSGTAHVRGLFNKQEIDDPRFVYSDGHLDTVGICIFLALRKRSEANPKLLVLDDIVLSIDLGHSERLVKLLRDEFKDHQILLFSHNELFMKMCRTPFSQAKHLEINRWTLEHGPRLVSHVTHVEELRKKLNESGSAEMVASAMRPVLDDFLHAACTAFEVKVPLTRDRGLTVDEYWSPLKPKLVELAKAGLLPDLTAALEKVGTPSFFRNALGAHSNEWALEATLRQVQRVADGVLELVEAVQCTRCQTVVRLVSSRDLAQGLACDCPKAVGPSLPTPNVSTSESRK